MADIEKVIRGLECLAKQHGIVGVCEPENCPYGDLHTCASEIASAALALLKSQEARVMDVGEVRAWALKQRVDKGPIFIEMRDGFRAWIVSDEYWDLPIETGLTSDVYGKTWRCWTSRPTDAQREAEPWRS